MEQRDGVVEFRTAVVQSPVKREHGKDVVREVEVLQYRQCFGGIWTPWRDVK